MARRSQQNPNNKNSDQSGHYIEDLLKNSVYTQKGRKKLTESIEYYINNLIIESQKVAERDDRKVIDKSDIERAIKFLGTDYDSRAKRILNTIGGITVGICLMIAKNILIDNINYSRIEQALTILIALIGSFLVSASIYRR